MSLHTWQELSGIPYAFSFFLSLSLYTLCLFFLSFFLPSFLSSFFLSFLNIALDTHKAEILIIVFTLIHDQKADPLAWSTQWHNAEHRHMHFGSMFFMFSFSTDYSYYIWSDSIFSLLLTGTYCYCTITSGQPSTLITIKDERNWKEKIKPSLLFFM